MRELMGIINLECERDRLNELTYFRCGAAVPFAGRYRIIDFVMSNMMHAGIQDIAIFVRQKYRSLMDHLGEGRAWDMNRKRGGLFILPPDWNNETDVSAGELRHIYNNLDFFERGAATHIVHSGSQHLSTVDLKAVYAYHLQQEADVTLVYTRVDALRDEHRFCFRLDIGRDGRVTDIHFEQRHSDVYMEIFVMEKSRFLEMAEHCIAHGGKHFFRDAIMKNRHKLNIAAYEYQGYHAVINSLESYYRTSMNLLHPKMYDSLFGKRIVHTKIKYEVPAKYLMSANVSNALVANGCLIAGEVKNSILFRGVQVNRGASIHNSIIMQKSVIGENVRLENVILDKDVVISRDHQLQGDFRKPFVIAKDVSI